MRWIDGAVRLTVAVLTVVCVAPAVAQPGVAIVPVEWPRPVYPQIARSARVQGDVEVAVDVRPDGSVAAVQVVRGIPLLDQAVTEAARRARFECRGCVDAANRYSLYVTFRLSMANPALGPVPLIVSPTQGWVTVVAPAPMIGGGPGIPDPPTRGIKCLFLWRCDPPARRARDAECLWLWRCGAMYEWL
jgi:TonB family protein